MDAYLRISCALHLEYIAMASLYPYPARARVSPVRFHSVLHWSRLSYGVWILTIGRTLKSLTTSRLAVGRSCPSKLPALLFPAFLEFNILFKF